MASVGAALPKFPFEIVPEAPFYIPATGPATRPRRTLKHDDTFLVLDSHGDIGASAGGSDGLFHCDTRFLSHLELLLNGTQPLLLGSNVRDDNTQLTVDLTNPDVYFEHRLVLPKDTLHVVRTIFLWRDTAYQRSGIQNHGDRALDLRLTMLFDSDFADLFEVRGLQRERRGAGTRQVVRPGTTVLSYKGLDAQLRQTVLSFDPPPTEITATTASYRLTLAPKQVTSICCTIGCGAPEPPKPVALARGLRAAHRNRRTVSSNAATVETSNDLLNEVLCRSMSDLYMLMTSTPQGRYPYAGIPWYSTTFGRDGLITALQMLWFDPRIARCGGSPPIRPRPTTRRRTRNRERFCMRCAKARWRRCARSPSASTTAASTRRRSSSCSPASMPSAPATTLSSWSCGPRSRPRSPGSTAPEIPMATAFSNTTARPSAVSPTKAGKIPRMRFSTPTAAWRRGRSRLRRCKATSIARSRCWHVAPNGWGGTSARVASRLKPISWRSDSTQASGARSSRPTRSRSTARRSPAASAARMPVRSCSPALPSPIGRSR